MVPFAWGTAALRGDNVLSLKLNGIVIRSISGDTPIDTIDPAVLVPDNSTLTWTYTKGANTSGDVAYVDNIVTGRPPRVASAGHWWTWAESKPYCQFQYPSKWPTLPHHRRALSILELSIAFSILEGRAIATKRVMIERIIQIGSKNLFFTTNSLFVSEDSIGQVISV